MMVAIPVNKCTAFISMVLCSRRICRIMFFFASLFHSSSTTTLEHQQPNSYRCFFCWCFFAFVFFHFPWPSTMNCIFTTCFLYFFIVVTSRSCTRKINLSHPTANVSSAKHWKLKYIFIHRTGHGEIDSTDPINPTADVHDEWTSTNCINVILNRLSRIGSKNQFSLSSSNGSKCRCFFLMLLLEPTLKYWSKHGEICSRNGPAKASILRRALPCWSATKTIISFYRFRFYSRKWKQFRYCWAIDNYAIRLTFSFILQRLMPNRLKTMFPLQASP